VYIVQQKTPGEPAQNTTGDAAWYNRNTGESQLIDPKSIQLVDAKYGMRPGLITKADPEKKKPRKPLASFKGPTRSYYERKGYSGH
jgi:hypothetical protein